MDKMPDLEFKPKTELILFKEGMDMINLLTNVIRNPVQKEEFRIKEIYKLSLRLHSYDDDLNRK
tara:strand:+ start:30 stop:221 length:192 start_codon:yes stop_codon:yes gene_type:complete